MMIEKIVLYVLAAPTIFFVGVFVGIYFFGG